MKKLIETDKVGIVGGERGVCMGCCMINMAGLAAVPALLVGSARNIFSKR
jgi:hypothetical protein